MHHIRQVWNKFRQVIHSSSKSFFVLWRRHDLDCFNFRGVWLNHTKNICTSMRHHQLLNWLSLRSDESYDELINVCNISLGINVYFCARATLGIFMGFKLCSLTAFSGAMKCTSLKYVTFKTYKNSYSWLCKLLMVHENNQLRISLKFHDPS